MIKPRTKQQKTLPEAEARLKASLEKLSGAVKAASGSKAEAARLQGENSKLDDKYRKLKAEYEVLERSLKDLQRTLKAMTKKGRAPSGNLDLSAEEEWAVAAHGADPETDFLKNELERVHKEYKSMDQSFKLLREQYKELQKTYEAALEGVPAEPDLLSEASEVAPTNELKKDLGAQLDKTIAALEKLAS